MYNKWFKLVNITILKCKYKKKTKDCSRQQDVSNERCMHFLWDLTIPYKLMYCVYINQLTVGKHVESLWVYKHKEVLVLLQNQRKSKECTWTCIDLNKSYYQFFTKGFLSLDLRWFSNQYFCLDIRNYLYKKRLQTSS